MTPTAQPPREQRAFNARIFRAKPDGTPFLNRFGFFMPRGGRRARPPQPNQPPTTPPTIPEPTTQPPSPALPAAAPAPEPSPDFGDISAALNAPLPNAEPSKPAEPPPNIAAQTCIGIIQTAFCLVGDDEGLLSETEKEVLRRPLQRVLDKYNIGEKLMPAELDLAVAIATLFIVRLQKPKTATKWLRFKAWFADRFFAAKGRQFAAKVRREVGNVPMPTAATATATVGGETE